MAHDACGDAARLGRLGRGPAAACHARRRGGRSVSQLVEQLSNRVMVLEANLDFVYRSLAYKQGDPMPSITTAQRNAQGLYSTTPGP